MNDGYKNLREIGGVLCATEDYLTTRAVVVGIHTDTMTYDRRYCYQDRAEADAALAAYTDPDKHPSGMWIKLKGVYRGEYVDALNPAWPEQHPWDKIAPRDET